MTIGYVDTDHHFKTTLAKDLRGLLLGDPMGYGTHRHVFHHATDPSLVVKLEDIAGNFYNVAEWEAWKSVRHTEFAKWFAPCVSISGNGTVLVMQKAKPVGIDELPRKVPAFFTDLKAENWGLLGKRYVALDYGLHLLHELGMTKRMRTANWT